ncbi:MAG: type III pantothenate kinase [Pseudomonadota bacterium]
MILCIDVGNSHIFAGVFVEDKLIFRFRHDTRQASTSDQLGVFLRMVLRENTIDPLKIKHISISSVVPSLDHSLASACIKYFNIKPFFLQTGVKTGLKIRANQVGADLIAGSIAAIKQFPDRNIIVIDFGTATTYSVVNSDKEFLGAVIQNGINTSMKGLQQNTANLPAVHIVKPKQCVGRSSEPCIQSGLYYGQLGAMREINKNIIEEAFQGSPALVIGTGGFVNLFEQADVFDVIIPDLVLHGTYLALQMNNT